MKRLFFILCLCGTLWQMSAQTGEYKMAGGNHIQVVMMPEKK